MSILPRSSRRGPAVFGAAGVLAALLAAHPITKPDADMQRVLDALASLHPKPIATLTAADARSQPTPSDAVKRVLTAEGRDTLPSKLVPGVTSVDRKVEGAAGELPARIYTPEGAGPFPVIVYYHGGGWVIANKDDVLGVEVQDDNPFPEPVVQPDGFARLGREGEVGSLVASLNTLRHRDRISYAAEPAPRQHSTS